MHGKGPVSPLEGENKKMDPLTNIYAPFRPFTKQFLKFLTEQVKSKWFGVRWKFTVALKL